MELRSPALCREAVRRDGYALKSVPGSLLAAGSEHRQDLCDLAYASPRPPRMNVMPQDLLTEARCIQSLRWVPTDLPSVPDELVTKEVCLTALRGCPPGCLIFLLDDIPPHLRDGEIAVAISACRITSQNETRYPPDEWYLPGAITEEVHRARQAHLLRHDQEDERMAQAESLRLREFDEGPWGSNHGVPYASQEERDAARSLAAVPESERTLARWEAAVEADPLSYGYVPPEHRSWPLLSRALRDAPTLLLSVDTQSLLPGGVTEAMCVEAVQRLGLSPLLIPEEISTRPTFEAAVRALPSLAYNAKAFAQTFDSEDHVALQVDDLTIEWLDRHLEEDPSRARHIGAFVMTDWAVAAYRHGGRTLESVTWEIPDGDTLADFLAEIGPFTEAAGDPDRDAKISSSSSSSAAAAKRPS